MSKVNGTKITKRTQLHELLPYDLSNLVFADPVEGAVPGSNPPVKFFRINIFAKNAKLKEVEHPDGTITTEPEFTEPVFENGVLVKEPEYVMTESIGDFMLLMDRSFSFGVSESIDPATKRVTGHSLAVVMYSKDGATTREVNTVDKLEKFIEVCKDHLLNVRKSVKQPKLEMSDLKNMNKLLYWKTDEDGNRIPGASPTLSPKLIEFNESVNAKGEVKPYQMVTKFYLEDEVDEDGNPREVDPLTFLSDNANKKFKLCYVRPVIKMDSIFIGAKISIQCKITESDIAPVQGGQQSLLHGRHKFKESSKTIISSKGANPLSNVPVKSQDEDEKEDEKEKEKEENELNDAPKKKTVVKKAKKAE